MGRVRVDQLGKCFKHYRRPSDRLMEWATGGRLQFHDPCWVLRGVSFEVEPGEGIGIVGPNGAGKTTLLKLVKGTVRPTEGQVEVQGRLAALELGLGFHPDFTGHENLLTGGAVIGLNREQVERLLPEIEDFAEIGRHLYDPVRTYSSGMQLRLAFSLATAVRPDVLLIDEALAVGDIYFQQKCIARIRRFREEGTTLLLVSHDPTAVKTLCDRAMLFDGGLLVREGPPTTVLEYYNALIAKLTDEYEIRQGAGLARQAGSTRSGNRKAVIKTVELLGAAGPAAAFEVGSPMRVRVSGRANQEVEELTVGISLRDRLGNEVFGTNTHHLGSRYKRLSAGDAFRVEFAFPVNLGAGHYSVTLALHAGRIHLEGSYDWWDNVCVFQVLPGREAPFQGCSYLPTEVRFEAPDDFG